MDDIVEGSDVLDPRGYRWTVVDVTDREAVEVVDDDGFKTVYHIDDLTPLADEDAAGVLEAEQAEREVLDAYERVPEPALNGEQIEAVRRYEDDGDELDEAWRNHHHRMTGDDLDRDEDDDPWADDAFAEFARTMDLAIEGNRTAEDMTGHHVLALDDLSNSAELTAGRTLYQPSFLPLALSPDYADAVSEAIDGPRMVIVVAIPAGSRGLKAPGYGSGDALAWLADRGSGLRLDEVTDEGEGLHRGNATLVQHNGPHRGGELTSSPA